MIEDWTVTFTEPTGKTTVLPGVSVEPFDSEIDEIVRLRARIAKLETKLAELETKLAEAEAKLAEAEAKLEQGGFY